MIVQVQYNGKGTPQQFDDVNVVYCPNRVGREMIKSIGIYSDGVRLVLWHEDTHLRLTDNRLFVGEDVDAQ